MTDQIYLCATDLLLEKYYGESVGKLKEKAQIWCRFKRLFRTAVLYFEKPGWQ